MRQPKMIDVNQLYVCLHEVVRYGVRAHGLYEHGRPLIDLLIPSDDTSDESYSRRAILAEAIIRKGIARESDTDAEALRITLSIDGSSSVVRKLETRRREAARLYGVLPNTFRIRHENALLHDLAFKILAIIICVETPAQSQPDDQPAESPRETPRMTS